MSCKLVLWFMMSSSFLFCFLYSLSSVAKKRPAYCGRILPVLLSLDPLSFLKGVHAAAANLALKTLFLSYLKCTHPAAAPVLFWFNLLQGFSSLLFSIIDYFRQTELVYIVTATKRPLSHALYLIFPKVCGRMLVYVLGCSGLCLLC